MAASALTPTLPHPLLLEALAQPRPPAWEALRLAAEAALEGQTLPTQRQEGWKYTELTPLKDQAFPPGAIAQVDIAPFILPEARGSRLVFVNGHFDSHHSQVSGLPAGVRFLNLSSASEMAHELGSLATPGTSDCFANLNSARFRDGVLVIVPKGIQVPAPLHVLFVSDQEAGDATSSHPRILVVVERNASLTLVEEYHGRGAYLTNAVTEVVVREDATLSHERIQRESPESFHFSHLSAKVERRGAYACRTITFGGRISRFTPHLVMCEEDAHVTLDGLALLQDAQVADTHSFIDHTVPHCTSRQTHKTIADGSSRAVFNGMIFVRPGAQSTDAQQQCRGLLLSGQARIDTTPQLEIFADDVKCAHGAAIGQLDPEAIFYLESRGLRPALARNLLTYAFASDLLARIPVASLRRQLRQTVLARTNAENLESLA